VPAGNPFLSRRTCSPPRSTIPGPSSRPGTRNVGLVSSAIGAYAVDTAPRRPMWLAATVTTAASTVGLALGVFLSGVLVEFGPAPRELTFCVFGVILSGCVIALAASPETVPRTSGAWSSLVPRLAVPKASGRYLPLASGIFVATWAFGGYFTSFGPSIAGKTFACTAP
jgi:MFS family permease